MICNSNLFSFRLLIYHPEHTDKTEKVLKNRPKNAVDVYVHHTIQLFRNVEIFLFIFSSEIRGIYIFLQELLIK